MPEIFERKVWGRSEEGLFITALLVIILTNLFDLGEVSMTGSAASLLIYGAVNIAHPKIYRETGANKYIIITAIISNTTALTILLSYMLNNAPKTLLLFLATTPTTFIAEYIYRKTTKRKLKPRTFIATKFKDKSLYN